VAASRALVTDVAFKAGGGDSSVLRFYQIVILVTLGIVSPVLTLTGRAETLRFAPEGMEPPRRLVVPGTHKEPPFDDHDPDARVAVLGPGPHAENLGVPQRFDDIVSKRSILRHDQA